MNNPKEIKISDYTYDLPVDRIARYPLEERDASKILVYRNGVIEENLFRNLADYIPPGSILVFNDTKVIGARILFRKPTGGVIELFCLEPYEHTDPMHALQSKEAVKWKCMVGGASKWKRGSLQKKVRASTPDGPGSVLLAAAVVDKTEEAFIIEFSWKPSQFSFAEILHFAGAVPLPPYIKRVAEESDAERYQTVYAREEGSVAAPTAGLHFTAGLMDSLKAKNIHTEFLTLHIGAGTFKPVKSETIGDHAMHEEWIEMDRDLVKRILDNSGSEIIAVGTTSLRSLESIYWLGHKIRRGMIRSSDDFHIFQWEPYESIPTMSRRDALETLYGWMVKNNCRKLVTQTQILIAPGYDFKMTDGLITNFHQPHSTPLLLVAAFTGNEWKRIYDHALNNNFRFLSYGDGSLLWKQPANEH